MRNALWSLVAAGIVVLAIIVLAPVLGFLFLVLLALLAVGALLLFGAPLLARLPWFRDRIHVERYGSMRSIRFGPAAPNEPKRYGDDDVIDVEGREIPGGDQ